jgi:hypothetical protein
MVNVQRNQTVKVSLEPHINIIVQYMLLKFQEEGLACKFIFQTACASLTTDDFIVPGRPVITKELMTIILSENSMKKWLRRVIENVKTAWWRRLLVQKEGLLALTPHHMPNVAGHEDPAILRQV